MHAKQFCTRWSLDKSFGSVIYFSRLDLINLKIVTELAQTELSYKLPAYACQLLHAQEILRLALVASKHLTSDSFSLQVDKYSRKA